MLAKNLGVATIAASGTQVVTFAVPQYTTTLALNAVISGGVNAASVTGVITVAPALANGTAGTFVPSKAKFPTINAVANGFAEGEAVLWLQDNPYKADFAVAFVMLTLTNGSGSNAVAAAIHSESQKELGH